MQSTAAGGYTLASHAAPDQVQLVVDRHPEACAGGEHSGNNGRNGEWTRVLREFHGSCGWSVLWSMGLSVIDDDMVYGEMLVRYDTTKDEREALVSVIIFPQSVLPKEKQIYIHSLTLFDSSVSE